MTLPATQGTFTSPGFIHLMDLAFLEFTLTPRICKVKAYLFDAPNVRYDIIDGCNFLMSVGIDILCSTQKCTWLKQRMPFHPLNYVGDKVAMCQLLTVQPIQDFRVESFLTDTIATKAPVTWMFPLSPNLVFIISSTDMQTKTVGFCTVYTTVYIDKVSTI
jgi:hypothetical protein